MTIIGDTGVESFTGNGSHIYGSTFDITVTEATGYEFVRWTVEGTKLGNFNENVMNQTGLIMGAGDVTLNIITQLETYTLTINANGGTYPSSTTITQDYGTTYKLQTPTRRGYTLADWTLSGDGDGSISGNTTDGFTFTFGVGDNTLTAVWSENSYNITFENVYNSFNVIVADKNGGNAKTETIPANGTEGSHSYTINVKFTDIVVTTDNGVSTTPTGETYAELKGTNPTRTGYVFGQNASPADTQLDQFVLVYYTTEEITGGYRYSNVANKDENWSSSAQSGGLHSYAFTQLADETTVTLELKWSPMVSEITLSAEKEEGTSTNITATHEKVYANYDGSSLYGSIYTDGRIHEQVSGSAVYPTAERNGYEFLGWFTSEGVQVISASGRLLERFWLHQL